MRSPRLVRAEHKRVCQAMKDLTKKRGRHSRAPAPGDEELYCRLAAVKMTLEWVHSKLVKTTAKGDDRFNELMGYRHIAMGPTHAVLYP